MLKTIAVVLLTAAGATPARGADIYDPADIEWSEPIPSMKSGWFCWIEHKDRLPDEMICAEEAKRFWLVAASNVS